MPRRVHRPTDRASGFRVPPLNSMLPRGGIDCFPDSAAGRGSGRSCSNCSVVVAGHLNRAFTIWLSPTSAGSTVGAFVSRMRGRVFRLLAAVGQSRKRSADAASMCASAAFFGRRSTVRFHFTRNFDHRVLFSTVSTMS